MSTGTVKCFNNSKGFGFIKDDESENEYFVHVTGLIDEIRENDKVQFDLKKKKKGLNAVNVKLAEQLRDTYHLNVQEPYLCRAFLITKSIEQKQNTGNIWYITTGKIVFVFF